MALKLAVSVARQPCVIGRRASLAFFLATMSPGALAVCVCVFVRGICVSALPESIRVDCDRNGIEGQLTGSVGLSVSFVW